MIPIVTELTVQQKRQQSKYNYDFHYGKTIEGCVEKDDRGLNLVW